MSLETLEGLPEEVAKLYKKGEDGKFHLNDENAGDGLKSALRKERERAEAAEKALKAREQSEEAAKAAKEREDLEKKGEYEKLRAQDMEALKTSKERAEALEAKFRMTSRDRFLQEAMLAVGAIPEALGPHVRDLFEDVPEGDGFKHVVKGEAGKKATDFLAAFKETKPWAFQPTGASGGGASQSCGSKQTKAWKDMTLDEQTDLYRTNPAQAKALQGA